MSKISQYILPEKAIMVDFPDIDGFKIEITYLGREELVKLNERCSKKSLNRTTRQMETVTDNEKFLQEYCKRAITGWNGLKMKHLPKLLAADIRNVNPEEEIPFDQDDALELLKNSSIFDQFLSATMNDVEQFSETANKEEEKNSDSTSVIPSKAVAVQK